LGIVSALVLFECGLAIVMLVLVAAEEPERLRTGSAWAVAATVPLGISGVALTHRRSRIGPGLLALWFLSAAAPALLEAESLRDPIVISFVSFLPVAAWIFRVLQQRPDVRPPRREPSA
jgi:hypothetical protein